MESSINASFHLPQMFLVRHPGFRETYFLLNIEFYTSTDHRGSKDLKIYKPYFEASPLQKIIGYTFKTNGFDNNSEEFFIDIKASVYSCFLMRTKYYIDSGSTSIYIYEMTEEVLSKLITETTRGDEFILWDYCFSLDQLNPPIKKKVPKKAETITSIPPHVFKILVEAMVEKKEICPISLEPLRLETTAGLPCGHLFEESSLTQALKTKMECPICRKIVLEGYIQKII